MGITLSGMAAFLRHVFGLRTIAPVGVTGVAGWATLWQLRMSVLDWDFWIFASIMLVFVLLSWGAIARHGWDNEREAARLQNTLDDLVAEMRAGLLASRVPEDLKDWSAASNGEIKTAVAQLTSQMSSFAHDVSNGRDAIFRLRREYPQMGEELRRREHAEYQAQRTAFNEQYRAKAFALREEMRKRLGIAPDTIFPFGAASAMDLSLVALDLGSLAGPDPVGDVIRELQRLAQKLSD